MAGIDRRTMGKGSNDGGYLGVTTIKRNESGTGVRCSPPAVSWRERSALAGRARTAVAADRPGRWSLQPVQDGAPELFAPRSDHRRQA